MSAILTKALANWGVLPNDAHIDVRTVAVLFGCSVPTVYRRVRAKQIPAPRKFGSSTRWNVGEIRDALTPEAV
ncbi:helix-turn-helix transcriptional regulator [Paraburkholderia aromaticivorans]|uniref:Transcriptional regulator n=1 Tax=Paraburkholderia aromaticivorans TaxID=2026199 RepID=A0A248VLX1_9BURK|nr:transcriptional regulator [Paraburkholderia aromaticivorans]ASW00017.1 transcriptional regulator [Paraburkholderia aromaticivorans]